MKEISVKKFIAAIDVIDANHYDTTIDREIAVLACLHNKPEEFFLSMNLSNFAEYRRELKLIDISTIEPKAPQYIHANGKVYAPSYDYRQLTGGQVADIVALCEEPEEIIHNLPKILASMCVPTKKCWFGRRLLYYKSADHYAKAHEEVANDMLEASIEDVYGIAVFFWAVWKGSLEVTGDSLVKDILKTKADGTITAEEAEGIVHILEQYGDGITARRQLAKK